MPENLRYGAGFFPYRLSRDPSTMSVALALASGNVCTLSILDPDCCPPPALGVEPGLCYSMTALVTPRSWLPACLRGGAVGALRSRHGLVIVANWRLDTWLARRRRHPGRGCIVAYIGTLNWRWLPCFPGLACERLTIRMHSWAACFGDCRMNRRRLTACRKLRQELAWHPWSGRHGWRRSVWRYRVAAIPGHTAQCARWRLRQIALGRQVRRLLARK
jgi:hypothetical protein